MATCKENCIHYSVCGIWDRKVFVDYEKDILSDFSDLPNVEEHCRNYFPKTTEEEVIQSMIDVGIELIPSDTTLGEQLQELLQKEDEYYTLYMLIDELYAREKSNNSVHQDLHGTSWVDLIDMAITLLKKIKNPE